MRSLQEHAFSAIGGDLMMYDDTVEMNWPSLVHE